MINVVILPDRNVVLVPDGADEVSIRFSHGRCVVNDKIRFQSDVTITVRPGA